MWAFMVVAIAHHQQLVKSEMVNVVSVSVTSCATIGVTVVPMPVLVS